MSEEKIKENPANDHLKVVVTEKQRTEAPSEKNPDGIQFSIGFSEHPAFTTGSLMTVIRI